MTRGDVRIPICRLHDTAIKGLYRRAEALAMTNSNTREAARRSTHEQLGRNLVHVYEQLAGQDRWVGMAYDATGGVVATASRGTLAATRDAIARASRRNAPTA